MIYVLDFKNIRLAVYENKESRTMNLNSKLYDSKFLHSFINFHNYRGG
jgi:hypothetical protein